MVGIALRQFGGMLPRYGNQHIPETVASIARNCRLVSGEIQALKSPALIYNFAGWEDETGTTPVTVTRAFRVVTQTGNFLVGFDDPTTDFVKAPLARDGFNRHYWTAADKTPRYASEEELNDATVAKTVPAGRRLGMPAPDTAPTVTPAATGGDLEETRVYVYTFKSTFGEESAPSPPCIVTGNADAAWNISAMDVAVADYTDPSGDADFDIVATEYDTTGWVKRIYRTITGTLGAVEYFFVAEVALATTTYSDTVSTETVSFNPIMESGNWAVPPKNLQGLLVHPNGFLVGFKGRDVYFSVPYRPHAWPVEFITAVKWNIVGLGIIGQSVVILTAGSPFIASGVRPEAMTLIESDTPDPCVSRRGIVSTNSGVYYPGPDGLMVADGNGVRNLTKKFVSRRDWQLDYQPYDIQAAKHDSQYVAFYDGQLGFVIDFEEASQAFVELNSPIWDHDGFLGDGVTGDVWLIKDNVLRIFDPEGGSPVPYLWRSKEFDMPTPVNFGAYKLIYTETKSSGGAARTLAERRAFNEERIQQPLNPINWSALNGVKRLTLTSTVPQYSQPTHRSPLYQLTSDDAVGSLTFRAYINREDTPYYEAEITDMELYRPDSGFKAILWQFEVEGTRDLQSIKIATTSKELERM